VAFHDYISDHSLPTLRGTYISEVENCTNILIELSANGLEPPKHWDREFESCSRHGGGMSFFLRRYRPCDVPIPPSKESYEKVYKKSKIF
jgi:hypothetical protein